MKKAYHSTKRYILAHKALSIVALIIVVFIGYKVVSAYTSSSTTTQYIGATVARETLSDTITGSGQVSASNEVVLKSKSSGTISFISPVTGEEIKAGTLIARLDSRDVAIDLENARIAMQKLIKPADEATLLQSENSLVSAKESARKAAEDLDASYNTALTSVAGAFVDLPSIIEGMKSALYSQGGFLSDQNIASVGQSLKDYRDQAGRNFDTAQKKYETALSHYKAVSSTSATSSIESITKETYDTVQALAIAVKDAKNFTDLVQSSGSYNLNGMASFQTNVNSWMNKVSTNLSSVSNASTGITMSKASLVSAVSSVAEKTASLNDLKNGPDSLDLASQQLSLRQKQNAYDDTFIRAPFDGVIAKTNAKLGDDVSSGASIATFITKQKTATISLNEVDAAKIHVGQKAELTFDAIDGLTIPASIAEIDGIGTVSQGVVTYDVKIAFNTQDDRVKSGMSTSATITTNSKEGVLVVPNSAVKTQGSKKYVEIFSSSTTAPTRRFVETGISNDTYTEIVSGLEEGEKVVTRTVTAAKTAQTPSILNAVGGTRGTGSGTGTRNFTR